MGWIFWSRWYCNVIRRKSMWLVVKIRKEKNEAETLDILE